MSVTYIREIGSNWRYEVNEEPRKFWMVIRGDEEGSLTSKRHYLYEDAINEAARLCRKEGKPFYVLETTRRAAPTVIETPIYWKKL